MSFTTRNLNRFAAGMADIQLERNQLAQEVIVVFNEVHFDHYQDSRTVEQCRVKKRAMVKKDTDMNYVQQEGAILLEEYDSLPWIVSLTITGLPRIPKMDDAVLIDGALYTISAVKPANRQIESIILLSIYPERSTHEGLKLISVSDLGDGYMDIVYGGAPIEYSFSPESVSDQSVRLPFVSRPPFPLSDGVPLKEGTLYVYDYEDNQATLKFNFT